MPFVTPILVVFFNRPDLVFPLVEALRVLKPSLIYLSGDGARENVENENELVMETRNLFLSSIDWDCEIHTRFSDRNAGLVQNTVSSIDWVFEAHEHLIVLEDDCVPHPHFFEYAQELLVRYNENQRVMAILGDNSGKVPVKGGASYTFSRYASPTWGMALWRRSWRLFDRDLATWDSIRSDELSRKIWPNRSERLLIRALIDRVKYQENHSWGWVWMYSVMIHNGLAILPKVNLISNKGFNRADAAHTQGSSLRADFPTEGILPLSHPTAVVLDVKASNFARDGRLFGLKKSRATYRARKFIVKKFRALKRSLTS